METIKKEAQNNINVINDNNNKGNEEDINIEELQKKLEEQEDINNNENDLFSHNLDNMLENIACLIASEK
jgi:hypothetical protein